MSTEDAGKLSHEELVKLVVELAAENERLRKLLEEVRRSGKRQASPFSKGAPKEKPKSPGRKPGDAHGETHCRATPAVIDETFEARLDSTCPHCGDAVVEEEVQEQYQTEVPSIRVLRRRFRVHVGRCRGCQRRIRGRHPLQTSDAVGAAASQIGPNALAIATHLRAATGASFGKIKNFFARVFDLEMSRGGIARALSRMATKLKPTYEDLASQVRHSPVVYADETGSRMNGRSWWLWVFTTPRTTVYAQRPSRGFDVIEEILGEDFGAILGHDGWAPYDRLKHALHQQCVTHLVRRAREMAEAAPQARFPRVVGELFRDALALRDRRDAREISSQAFEVARGRLLSRLVSLLICDQEDPHDQRFRNHLLRHLDALFAFLWFPEVEAANWPAEQAIRPAVIFRKMSGGHRSSKGAETRDILTSVIRTCVQRATDAVAFIREAVCQQTPGILPIPPIGQSP